MLEDIIKRLTNLENLLIEIAEAANAPLDQETVKKFINFKKKPT